MSSRELTPVLLDEISLARGRTAGLTVKTDLVRSSPLEDRAGSPVLLKLENRQKSGSFKYRGALNKVLAADERGVRGVCTGSTGNHGLALAEAAAAVGLRCVVLLPDDVPRRRVDLLEAAGVEPELIDGDVLAAEREARRRGTTLPGFEYVSPYNDIEVIAGNALVADEVLEEVPGEAVDLYCATGGGGLVAGLGAVVKASSPSSKVFSVAPSASPVLGHGVRRGWLIEEEVLPTLSDATAGNIDLDSITLDLCRELVDEFIEVAEEEISAALRLLHDHHHLEVEGSAGAALAGVLRRQFVSDRTRPAVVVICGGN